MYSLRRFKVSSRSDFLRRLTDQEALQSIAAVAERFRNEAPAARTECGEVIRRLNNMTAAVGIDAFSGREALDLVSEVLGALETSKAEVFGDDGRPRPHTWPTVIPINLTA